MDNLPPIPDLPSDPNLRGAISMLCRAASLFHAMAGRYAGAADEAVNRQVVAEFGPAGPDYLERIIGAWRTKLGHGQEGFARLYRPDPEDQSPCT